MVCRVREPASDRKLDVMPERGVSGLAFFGLCRPMFFAVLRSIRVK